MQGSPDAKKPCKGILKTSSSFDRHSGSGASYRKSAKFDELNVLQTYHPPDKDYGHMKIEEPKTPYNYAETDPEHCDELDAELLAEKLRLAANARTSFDDDDEEDSSDDAVEETEEQRARRLEFEKRRKAHYNEYEAVRLARKLIEEEDDDDDEEDDEKDDKQNKSPIQSNSATRNPSTSCKDMDVDIQDDAQTTTSSSQH